MRWASLVVGLSAAACSIEHSLVECPGDTLCPVGSVCEPVHGGCALPEQLEVCVGVADGDRCVAGSVIGYCLDAICIDPTCGNRVVDPGEICDDGNRKDGDGCNATCASAERCGDGAVDPQRDEECDDGNLVSRDGCDSRCLRETLEWSVDELGPTSAEEDWMTWDPVRARVVMVADGFVWGWDGIRWEVLADNAPQLDADYDVTFDVTRNRLVVLAMHPQDDDFLLPNPPRDTLYEWDGTSWTMTMLQSSPELGRHVDDFAITYDPVSRRLFAFGIDNFDPSTRHAGMLDLTTGIWKALPVPAGTYYPGEGFDVAYDEARSLVVLVTAGTTNASPVVHEWNGSGWASFGAPMTALREWTLAYDAALQRVVAVGGEVADERTPVQSWNGTSWSALPDAPDARDQPGVVFDRARQVRVVFGGSFLHAPDDLVEWNGSAWRVAPRTAPPVGADGVCASDEGLHRLVCTGVPGAMGPPETWVRTAGVWTRLVKSLPETTTAMMWDPIRRSLVVWTTAGPVQFVGDELQSLSPAPPTLSGTATGIAFDPTTRDLVIATVSQFIGDSETLWLHQDGTVDVIGSEHFSALAFDARNGSILGLGEFGMYLLDGQVWERIVGPANGYAMVANARRGTVEFISAGLRVLERIGTSWSELADPPPRSILGTVVMEQHSGELHVIGRAGSRSRFMLHRRWVSATPLESCVAGEDVDGDGRAGCDDGDCWDTCDACPPYASCP